MHAINHSLSTPEFCKTLDLEGAPNFGQPTHKSRHPQSISDLPYYLHHAADTSMQHRCLGSRVPIEVIGGCNFHGDFNPHFLDTFQTKIHGCYQL